MRGRNGTSHRPERIASVLKRDITVIVESLEDPRIAGVTVTDVEMSRDYKYANVFVTVDGDEQTVLSALNGSAGYIRRTLAEENSEMRGVPRVRFTLDKSGAYYEHIEQVIKGLHRDEQNDD